MDAPRESLIRANFEERATVDDGRTMTGYPIVFDQWTTINSWEGEFKERIAPGALRKTLRENSHAVKVLFNHGMDPSIGDKPLGRASVMRADAHGLYVEVPMSDTSYNDDLIALMRDGALDGMSFRFSVPEGKDSWERPKRGLPERTINELRLFELGPVTFPAYQATTVGIRSRDDYSAWLGVDDQKRSEIARIMGISHDLRTHLDEAGDATSDDESRDTNEDLEPQVQHSSNHLSRHAALAAMAKLKETRK
jgi:HK97 family phage prohead protease